MQNVKERSSMNIIALAIGAFVGTIFRYEMGRWIEPLSNGFPIGTLMINLVGSLFLGWFSTIVLFRLNLPLSVRIGIGTGFTGSFTTFSTFSLETMNQIKNHHLGLALIYVLISVCGGVIMAAIGYFIAKYQSKNMKREKPA